MFIILVGTIGLFFIDRLLGVWVRYLVGVVLLNFFCFFNAVLLLLGWQLFTLEIMMVLSIYTKISWFCSLFTYYAIILTF